MKKIIFLSIMFFSVAVGSWAAKAIPMPVKVTQPDGTVLTVMLYGDEHFHYYTTTDGALLYPNDDAFYIAHVESDGSITSTNLLAHQPQAMSIAEQKI
jgi:hypothetical protein